jgi:hypothetical protein
MPIWLIKTFVVVLILGVYALSGYYLYRRGAQAFSLESRRARRWFGLTIGVLYASYFIGAFGARWLGVTAFIVPITVGAWTLSIALYSFLALLLVDLGRLLLRKPIREKRGVFADYDKFKRALGWTVAALAVGVTAYGHANMRTIETVELALETPKRHAQREELRIVFFSDSHFDLIRGPRFARDVVEAIRAAKPDVVIMGGDLIDAPLEQLEACGVAAELRKLEAPLGVYGIFGNHEYIVGEEAAEKVFGAVGMIEIRDTAFVLDSTISILARDDLAKLRTTGVTRAPLEELLLRLDRRYPTLLLDHQPFGLEKTAEAGIDFQLSGHTHNGQLFPGNLIAALAYRVAHGVEKIGETTVIVSSGVGSWGPPIKVGARSEIIVLTITFV